MTPVFGIPQSRRPSSGNPFALRQIMSSTPPWVTIATCRPAMRARQRAHRREHPAAELTLALAAAGQREVGSCRRQRPELAVALLHLLQLQPLEHAEALLAQPGQQAHREAPGSASGAAVSRARCRSLLKSRSAGAAPAARPSRRRLRVAGGVQRHVDLALEAQLAVPVGLAVADDGEVGHRRGSVRRDRDADVDNTLVTEPSNRKKKTTYC